MLDAGSWKPGCPVAVSELRILTLTYWGFDGSVHTGRLMVHVSAARPVAHAMRRLFQAHFPIRRMQLVEAWGASDERSMAADNTSAFNARQVPGFPGVWSEHAKGTAIDINPLENPMIRWGEVSPPKGARFVNRSLRLPGMVHADDVVVCAFEEVGWKWGGDYHSLKDYQHFSATGL
jgi:D-alanyl-D-alanine carboxypeptidase